MMDCCNNTFVNCISLGWYCGTASAMGKYGLRSCSGPFDWYWSDLESVVSLVKTEFEDFMSRDNLERRSDNPLSFHDKKYGFDCFHDIPNDLDADYETMYAKYMRRANRFLEMLKKPTLLIRAVRSDAEVEYIIREDEEIKSVFRKYNRDNTVIYVMPYRLPKLPNDIRSFSLGIESYGFDAAALREMFDKSPELLAFLSDSFDSSIAEKNKRFDMESNDSCAAMIYSMVKEDSSAVCEAMRVLAGDVSRSVFYLWGLGHHGRAMYEYLKRHGFSIAGVIDEKLAGEMYEEQRIMTPTELPVGATVFVSIADKKTTGHIENMLKTTRSDVRVIDYRELYNSVSGRE